MTLFFTGPTSPTEAPPLVRRTFGRSRERQDRHVRVLRLPGVYAPQEDTELLLRTVLATEDLAGARVLDVCTGTGRLALGLAAAGAADVTASDISRRAVLAARLNAVLNALPVRAVRGDLLDAVTSHQGRPGPPAAPHDRLPNSPMGRQFDVIVANPPYVPGPSNAPGRHSAARAWDAGPDGRVHLDRICVGAPRLLSPDGSLWIVHSTLSGPQRTVEMLAEAGLDAEVAARAEIPFGPVLRARADWLRARGLLGADQQTEGLVVVRGRRL